MKIAYITAGAAGMYCGSCMHDNTLVAALRTLGHDALLIPTYTPIRTDEADVSQGRVFFGGINVFLQEKSALFRHTPWFLDRLLDAPWLLRWASKFAVKTKAEDLGGLTLSMLRGDHGRQRKEIDKVLRWLKRDIQPDIVQLSNVLLSGMARRLKEILNVPILAALQGDDIFLEALAAGDRTAALDLIRVNSGHFAGFVATSQYYADFMAGYVGIPRERIHVIYPGLNLALHEAPRNTTTAWEGASAKPPAADHNGAPRAPAPFTIGYFARICPEKGIQQLFEAFRLLKEMPGMPPCRLRVSGWLGDNNRPFFQHLLDQAKAWGLERDVEHVESPGLADKVRFLQSLDVLSVPTVYHEPKGLYVLEALAHGVPVVQPRHGSFPELLEATGGGLLVNPNDPADLARVLRRLTDNPEDGKRLGRCGQDAIRRRFNDAGMAQETVALYEAYLGGRSQQQGL